MAGLLGDQYTPDPLAQGLLGLGSALLTPRQMGGGLMAGANAFTQGATQAAMLRRQMAQDAMRQKLIDAQIGEIGATADWRKAQIAAAESKDAKASADAAALQDARTAFETAYSQANGQWSPQLSMMAMRAGIKGEDLDRLAKGSNLGRQPLTWQNGLGLDPFTGAPQATAPDVNKPFFPSLVNGQVSSVPNKPVQDFEVGKARAGATNIGLPKIEVKMGDSVGGQVGPMLKDSATAVGGAVKMADAAERILTAVDQGSVIAGPTASLRLKGAQVASMLGIGGKDAVAQTRQVIRGLAESSVEARKELAGQGQVTENEAKAVDKALSGNIDDLTVEEIRDIARLNLRHAAGRARQHQQYLSSMPESLAPARPFYTVPGMERLLQMDPAKYEIRRPPPASVQPDGRTVQGTIGQPASPRVLRFDANGNPVK